MTDEADVVFTTDQIASATTAMRTALGLPPEHFSTAKFVGMISDEIEQLRTQGWADKDIADLIAESTGSIMNADSIAQHYTTAEDRGPRVA